MHSLGVQRGQALAGASPWLRPSSRQGGGAGLSQGPLDLSPPPPTHEGPCPLGSQAATIPDRPHWEGTSASICANPSLMDTEARK